jgi:hypothetical protein
MKIKWILATIAVVSTLSAPVLTAPAQAAELKLAARKDIRIIADLRGNIHGTKFREGRNVIFRNRDVQLVAVVRRGKIVSLTPYDMRGKVTSVFKQHDTGTDDSGPRPCLWCYGLETVLAGGCIELPCPMVRFLRMIERWTSPMVEMIPDACFPSIPPPLRPASKQPA